MTDPKTHAKRVKRELRKAGVGRLGFMRFGIRYLPKVIKPDEHIHGVVYGRYREKEGTPAWEEGTLVATETRVIFLDRKPGYVKADDISYDVVSGVEASKVWIFSSVTLFTRLGNFTLLFTRPECARRFVLYVESRRLESTPQP